jgi:DNA primase
VGRIKLTEEVEVLVELLKDVLGDEKQHYESKGQISFDCPVCAREKGLDKGDGKGNLEINYYRHVYKCWACSDTNGTQGPLGKLFDQFGTKKQKKVYNLIKPEEQRAEIKKVNKLKFPEGYTTFQDSNPRFIPHIEAMRYLNSRGITEEIINKYKIGYTVSGEFAYRIIVPSFDSEGQLNYFIARSWVPRKMKYKNPTAEKDKIIFNESIIDWEKDIYLVEGVFDGFFLNNSIPMLGKKISVLLFETLYTKAKGNIIICTDGDAWNDGLKIYHELNGGTLYNKIKIIKLPKDKDVCDLRGEIDQYYYEIK